MPIAKKKRVHVCPNRYYGEGAKGGCYFEIDKVKDEKAWLRVGWSCVVVHDNEIQVSWLSEVIAIATAHEGGIAGFLAHHHYGSSDSSYALMCNPSTQEKPK